MEAKLQARSLEQSRVQQAYPLIQFVLPEMSLAEWVGFVDDLGREAQMPEGSAGVISVESTRGYIHGLYSYMVERHLRHGRALEVDNFIAFDMANRLGVTQCLLTTMDELAARFECGAVHVNLPHRSIGENQVDSGLLRAFQAHGHDVKHLGLCKTLSTP